MARHGKGDVAGAIADYESLAKRDPVHPGLLANLATALKQAGRRDEALETFARAVAAKGAPPEAWFNYGNLLLESRKRDEAEAAYRRALELNPDLFPAAARLGRVLYGRGELEESERWYRAALERAPKHAETLSSYGVVLKDLGRRDEAIDCWQRVLAVEPKLSAAHNNLGALYRMMRKPKLANDHLRAALRLEPRDAVAAANLAHVLLEAGQTTEAEILARGITERSPESAEGHHMLGFALAYQGDVEAAIGEFRAAHKLSPKSGAAISSALFASLYSDRRDAEAVLELHRELAPEIVPAHPPLTTWKNGRDPSRRLKVGYLSPDLRTHPVSMFLEPILEHHDKKEFEVICYSTTNAPDATTERLQSHSAQWHDCSGWGDARIAALIESDGVDILVDLAGHTAQNSASVFRAKPAPVQVAYIGYPGSTGLPEMEWLLADDKLCPPGAERHCSEKVMRLEQSYWCYRPPAAAPDPGPLPALANGYVTFGSYNAYQKLTDRTVALWADVLKAVPGSRLALKALAFADDNVRRAASRRFAKAGIEEARIETLPPTDPSAYLQEYRRLDIALDPTPYNGATTTCEALWMGVPVITLAGDRFCGRMGTSVLRALGYPELIAESPEAFVRIAGALARDLRKLQAVRGQLRGRMSASPLCDGPRSTKAVEKAYRAMWVAWTGSG